MPTLTKPTSRQRFTHPIGPASHTQPTAYADEVVTDLSPDASTGNTVEDHLSDIISRLGHPTDTEIFKGLYDNSATYAVGDEVAWIDPDDNNRKKFFKRLIAGDDGSSGTPLTNAANWDQVGTDIHNVVVKDVPITRATASGLWRSDSGEIFFNRRVAAMLLAAQTEADVTAVILSEMAKVVTNSRWRDGWIGGTNYAVNDYVVHSGSYHRCLVARGSSDQIGPAGDTTGWTPALTGVELDVAKRLEDINGLLSTQLDIVSPAAANRGRWIGRAPNGESFQYRNPPMHWVDMWSAAGSYYFGAVCINNSRLWVLKGSGTITTPKTGAGSEPGTDSDWEEISIGHTSDVAGWRGEWSSLAGAEVRKGDIVVYNSNYYIAKQFHTVGTSGPDENSTDWDLLDTWIGPYRTNTWYALGGIVTNEGHVWLASDHVRNDDPAPGASNNTKWIQIDTEVTNDDLEQLRRDVADLTHGVATTRGVVVNSLPTPSAAVTDRSVWVPAKRFRSYTAPSGQVTDNQDVTEAIGYEAGHYDLTQGTVNRCKFVLGKHTTDANRIWYGAFTRTSSGAPWAADVGRITHSPVESGIIAIGAEQFSATEYHVHVAVKGNLLEVLRHDTHVSTWYLKLWDHNGTAQTDIPLTRQEDRIYLGDVQYEHWRSVALTSTVFGTLYEAGSSDADRTMEARLSDQSGAAERWLGNNEYAWTRKTPPVNHNDLPVFSSDVHDILVMSDTQYAAMTTLPPNALILTHP